MTRKREQPSPSPAEKYFIHVVGEYGFTTKQDRWGNTFLPSRDIRTFRALMGKDNNYLSLIQKVRENTLSPTPSEINKGINIYSNEAFLGLPQNDKEGVVEFVNFLFDCIDESAKTVQQKRDDNFILRRNVTDTQKLNASQRKMQEAIIMKKKWQQEYLPALIRPLIQRQYDGKNDWVISDKLRTSLASCVGGIADMMNWISVATDSDPSVISIGLNVTTLKEFLSSDQEPEEVDPRYKGISQILPGMNNRRTSSGDRTQSEAKNHGLKARIAQERVKTLGVK